MATEIYAVGLTPAAKHDIRRIFDHVRQIHGTQAARSMLNELLEAVGALEAFPFRGTIPLELEGLGSPHFRQIWSGPNRLIYRVGEKEITVMVVADGRRNLTALLERRILNS